MALESTLVPKNWRDRGGGFRQPQEVAAPAAPADTGMRPVGFRNTGAIREQALQTGQLGVRGAEMGEPTSFRAGAGAPEPIGVMRGTATTYSPGTLPGRQFAEPEMATPLQAQQVWNRGMAGQATAAAERGRFTDPRIEGQYGGFRAPGQTLEEVKGASHVEAMAAYSRDPSKVAAGDIAREKQAQIVKDKVGTDFTSQIQKRYGTPTVGKGGTITHDISKLDPYVLRDMDEAKGYAMEQGDPKAGHNYMEWSQRLRDMYPQVYADTMKANPMAWADVVRTHGPQLPAVTTAPPAAATGFTEPQKVGGGLSPFSVGP